MFRERLLELLGPVDRGLFVNEDENSLIIIDAERALSHVFDVLGSEKVRLEPMQWNKDLKTGFEWENGIFYLNQRNQKGAQGSDVKQPWELSRCHHLLWLGEAYIITGNEKYAKAVIEDIEDWINKNPIFYSINWTCSMEVAIRALNWLYALNMVSSSSYYTDSFVKNVVNSLYQHGFYIYNHLEKTFPYSFNHYMSDIVGLLFLGLVFREETKGKWFRFASSELFLETRLQVLPSGLHYEKSISYHRLITELLGSSFYLLKRSNESIPADVEYRIMLLFKYVESYTKPNGKAPLIGDNDNGRILPFVKRDFLSHNYLCNDSLEMRILRNGLPFICRFQGASSNYFSDAGVAIIRTKGVYLYNK